MQPDAPIQLVGIPFDAKSSFASGPAGAPGKIREELFSPAYNPYSESVTDVLSPAFFRDAGDVGVTDYESIGPAAEALLHNGRCLFLGGDHSISFPLVRAANRAFGRFHILHFDAHGDLYDVLGGDKFSHACPFARIMEAGLALSLTQVGIRTMTSHQLEQAERFGVQVYTMREIESFDPAGLEGPLYISLDLDVLDPAFAPGLSHREPGGVSTRQLISWIQQIRQPIVCVDLVEYNPLRDFGNTTATVCAKLVKELLDVMLKNKLPATMSE